MDELEIVGGENELTFRRKHTKESITARLAGPREIVGIPGEWVDAVFNVDGNCELLELVLDHMQSKRMVDRVIVKLTNPKKRMRSKLEDWGFVHLGRNIFVKPINPELSRFL